MTTPVRILIVEDKPDDIDLAKYEIHKILSDCEFQVAETCESFMQALETFQPDLILAEYTLPHFDGMSALKLTLHHAPLTPLVIWTDSVSEDVAVDCVKAGANNYILKDNLKRLGPAILRALEERKLLLENKQAREALQNSEKRFRALIQNGMASIALLAADGMLIWESPAAVGTLHYAPNQHLGQNIFRELMHPDDLPWTQDMFARLVQEPGSREHSVFRLRHADGTWHWVEAVATNMLHEPEIRAIVANYRDIHEQKQAEEALLNSERRFRALIENGQDDISLLAADGTLLWESPSTIRNLGYAPKEFVGRNIFQLVHPEDLASTQNSFAKLLQTPGDRQCGNFRLRRADGTWRWVEAIASNMLHEPCMHAIVINYRDITEQKQAEIELQQRNDDLALINSLNEVINRGETLDAVMNRLRVDVNRVFSCEYTNIYLLNEDGRSLKNDQYALPPKVKAKIEKLIGRAIPSINISVRPDGLFQQVLCSDHGLVTSDSKVIQNWIREFIDTTGLPSLAKTTIRKLIPQIHKVLNIRSIILVPLVSDGKILGVLNVSSSNTLQEKDLKRIENISGQLITALHRKQVEDALQESQARYQNLVETSHDLIWSVDAEGRFTFVNRASREIYGYEPEELIGRSFFEIMDPEHYHTDLKIFKETIANPEEIRESETYVRHRDGRSIILSANSIVLRDEHGAVTGVVGSSHDITVRKQVEDVLKDERNLLRTLIDNVPDRIYAMDKQGRKTLSNTADWRASGEKTMEDVLGKTDFDTYPPELAEEFWKLDRAVLDSGQPIINYEESGLDADGNSVSILTTKIPLRDDEGNVIGLVSIGRDITERKQAEERLRYSENRYRLVTQATNDIIWEWSPKTHQLFWSENAQHVFGYSENEIGPDETWWDNHIHPEDRERVLTKLNALIEGTESIWMEEYRFLLRDGSYAYVSDHAYIERDENRIPLRMIGAMANITERKRSEDLLRESEERFSSAFEYAAIGMALMALDGRWLRVNWAFSTLVGYSEAELLHKTIQDITHPEDLQTDLQHVRQLITGEIHSYQMEKRYIHKEGHVIWTLLSVSLVQDNMGKPLYFISQIQDITERKRVEEEIRKEIEVRTALFETTRDLVIERDLPSLLQLIVERATRLLGAGAGGLYLCEPELDQVRCLVSFNTPRDFTGVTLRYGEGAAGMVAQTGEPLILDDYSSWKGKAKVYSDENYFRALLSAPIQWQNQVLGVIHVLEYQEKHHFTTDDLSTLLSFANQAAIAIHNARLLQQAQEEIVERKRAEEAVRQSENKARALLNAIPDLMFHLDSEGTILDYKADKSELYAQSEPSLTGLKLRNISPPEFADLIDNYIHKTLSSATMQVFEYQLPIPGHGLRDYEARMVASGEQQVTAIVRNITERKRAEEALRAERAKAQKYLDIAGVMMLALDQEGTVILINQKGCEILGYSADEIIGKDWIHTFLPEPTREELQDVFQKLISDSMQPLEYYENTILTKSGEERLIAWHNTLLRDEQGKIISTLSSGEDITERKRAEEEIHHRAKETSALLETSLALTNLDLEATLQTIGNSANTLFLADGCRIFLLEQDEETLQCVLALGKNTAAFLGLRLKLGEGVAGAVAASGVPEIVNQMQDDPRAVQIPGTEEEQEAIMFAPLKERGRTIGILSIRRIGEKLPFEPADLGLLEAFASMAASAVSKARLFEETQHQLVELRHSEERFRQLADNIQEAFWMTDAESDNEIYVSPAADTIWGRPMQSLMYEPDAFITSVFSEDRLAVMNAIEREKNGEKVQLEYRIVRPDGSLRWIWDRAFPIYDDAGKVKIIAGISADITERKQIENQIRVENERFLRFVNSNIVGIVIGEANGNIILANDYYLNILGVSREALLDGKVKWTEFTPPEWLEADEQAMRQLRETGVCEPYEKEYKRADGSRVPVYIANAMLPGSGEQIAAFILDITERKQQEHQLRKLSSAVEHSGSTIVITDTAGNIEYVNRKFTQVTGYSFEEVLGQNPRLLKSGFTTREEYEQLWQMITSGQEWHGELLNRKKDGTLFWESVTVSPILNDRKEITHFVGIKEDVTERKQTELEIRRHIAELEAVYENGLSVGRLLEPREIGDRVIETFARYLPWHHVTIRLRKEGSDDLELVSFNLPNLKAEEKMDAEQHFIARVNKVGQGLSGWVIQTGLPLRTGNVHAHPQYIDTHAGIQSGLYLPLKVGDRIVGAISVESETPDAFTEQDERLLATLANQTAIAFENARLYEAIQKELLERKRAEEALRVSETHYRALADSITDILFEMDQDLHYTHWNKASEALTGIPAERAIGKSIEEIFGATEEQTRIKTIYEDVLRTHQPRTFEMALALSGEKHSFEVNAYPSMRGVSVVAKDVTDRKRNEIIMQKRFELMEYSAGHSLPELMQRTVDEVSELTGSTIGFLHFMGEDQNHLGMQTWSTNALRLFQVADEDGVHLPLDQAGVWAAAVRQRRPLIQNDYQSLADKKGIPQGHVPVVREIVIPIIRNERIMAVMGIGNKPLDYTAHDLEIAARLADYAWDVTERKQMELALEVERNQLVERVEERTADLSRANSNLARALRVKDEFLANMSHELRTPLNAILGLSESLGEQIAGPLNEKQQKYISTISESGHHLLSLINDILDLAKIDAGQITMDINKVDIHSVCQASLRMIKQLAQKKNQEVSLEIDQGLGLMWADERRLKQMIVNLLGNAVKFTPENGRLGLEVHGDQESNQIAITVWDNGIGIKHEDLTRLFQPFVQLDSGLAREAPGTGLGLTLVAQMARLHGGSVSAVSESGQGSRFTIVLPWEPALAIDTASRMRITGKFRAIQLDETNKPTILLVEDTKEVVMMVQDYLELAGYKVFTAQDGIDGIVQARHVKPDLILMDIQMPHMDGFETTRKLRSDPNFRYTPIIALTALAMPHDRERCLEAGMDEYISKPVNLKALIKIIQGCLFEKESHTQ